MNILAISDATSRSLESMLQRSLESLRALDMVVSCGDLKREYLEVVADSINRDFFFVSGNHDNYARAKGSEYSDRPGVRKSAPRIAGYKDLHGRVVTFKNYLVVGFSGSMWYNGGVNQYTERQMAKVVAQVISKVRWHRMRDRLMGRKRKEVIVLSHAPIFGVHDEPDICHTGFKCFKQGIKAISPVMWLHGHVHLLEGNRNQISMVGRTTVINTYGHRFVTLKKHKIEVSPHKKILKT